MVAVLVVEVQLCTKCIFLISLKYLVTKIYFELSLGIDEKKSKFHIFADNGLTTSGTYHAIIMIKPPAIKKMKGFIN